jgi:hypothetical protein
MTEATDMRRYLARAAGRTKRVPSPLVGEGKAWGSLSAR